MTRLENKKISEKLLQLVKPYLKMVESHNTEKRLTTLLIVGSAAWNMGVTGNNELKNVILRLIDDKEELSEMENTINNLIQRKKRLFPDDDRYILDCKINSIKRRKYDITVSYRNNHEQDKVLQ